MLAPTYGAREAGSMARLLLEHLGIDRARQLAGEIPPKDDRKWLEQALEKILDHVPIQHILGTVMFYDCELKVNPHVLIPRNETEELVDLVVRENSGNPEILDIGTGSGCIAIALKKAFPESTVKACDISEEALNVAKENAERNEADVRFHHIDVLHLASIPGSSDIIVSNPPYVMQKERVAIDRRVVDFEPENALFVSDEDPLVFYRRICELATRHLPDGGQVYFEINEALGPDVKFLMGQTGFTTEIKQDLNGKDRFAKGIKHEKT